MGTDADLLVAFGCPDDELDLPPVDLRHLGLPADQASDWRRRKMAHVDGGADGALPGIEIGPDRIEGGVSMTIIITGVANTGGRIASLNRFARCSGRTRRLKEPLAPWGICLTARPQKRRGDEPELCSDSYRDRKLRDPSTSRSGR